LTILPQPPGAGITAMYHHTSSNYFLKMLHSRLFDH
jgi:hypothetical protein